MGDSVEIDGLDLQPGQRLRVMGVRVPDSPSASQLQLLGFVPGTLLEFVRRAPLGDPIELRMRGTLMAVRLADLQVLQLARA